ncbi:hypothetical protein TruAng_005608 [Truncatella angustata]|nr:hypothetical protein TruAng_005608 [Truncatella angustata]
MWKLPTPTLPALILFENHYYISDITNDLLRAASQDLSEGTITSTAKLLLKLLEAVIINIGTDTFDPRKLKLMHSVYRHRSPGEHIEGAAETEVSDEYSLLGPRHVSRKAPPKPYVARFGIAWDPWDFHSNEGYSESLQETWPQTGQSLIKILQYAVKDNPDILHTLFLLDGIHLTVQRCHNFLTIQVKGNQFAIVEVGEQMGWISTALRSSSQDDSIAAFRLIIQSCELRDSLQKDKETSHRPDTCVDLRSLQTNRPYTAWFGHIRRLLDDVITHSYSRSRVSDLEKKRTAAWYRNPNRRVALRHVGSSHRSLRTDLTRTLLPGYTGEYGGTHCGFDEAR